MTETSDEFPMSFTFEFIKNLENADSGAVSWFGFKSRRSEIVSKPIWSKCGQMNCRGGANEYILETNLKEDY